MFPLLHSFHQTELEQLAERLAKISAKGDVIALFGTLGMGKTVFCRAFIRSLGLENEEVPSPTFTLVQTYDGKTKEGKDLSLWHFDWYRLKKADEVYELGFEEALSSGVSLIEWPDRAISLLPKNRLEVTFSQGENPDERRVALVGIGEKWQERIKEL